MKKKNEDPAENDENMTKTAEKEEIEAGQEQQEELESGQTAIEEKQEKEAAGPDLAEQNLQLQNKYLLLLAEFDNFRKRTNREKADLLKYSGEEVMTALLPILDDFQRSLNVMDNSDNLSSIREGIKLVSDNLSRFLEKSGLKPMESMGKEFDTTYHEALQTVPVQDESQKGKVIEVVEKGYLYKDKVIRFARVIVGE